MPGPPASPLAFDRSNAKFATSLTIPQGEMTIEPPAHLLEHDHKEAGFFMQPFLKRFSKSITDGAQSFITEVSSIGGKRKKIESFRIQTLCFANLSNTQSYQERFDDCMVTAEKTGQNMRVPVPQTKIPLIGEVKSLVLKQLLCGIIAGAVASVTTTPLQILRTRVIAGRGGTSTAEVLQTVAKHEGMQSLLKGSLLIATILSSLEKGVQFATFEAVKRKEEQKLGRDHKWLPGLSEKVPITTVAGALAGLASTLVMYPFQAIADRLTFQPSVYTSINGALIKVAREEGVRELYRGVTPAMMTMVPQAAARFYTYETLKKKYMEGACTDGVGVVPSLMIGAAAGVVASALTYPLEIARKHISMSALPLGTVGIGGAIHYSNIWEALSGIVHTQGAGALYRGFPLEALAMVPTTAVSFLVYEVAKRALVAQNEERCDQVKNGV